MKIPKFCDPLKKLRPFAFIGTAWAVIGFSTASAQTTADGYFLEQDGIVAFEIESMPPVPGWSEESSVSGYSGDGYFRGTFDSFSQGGNGTVSYPIYVSNGGDYQLQWRSKIGHPNETTEFNDSFARLTDADGNPINPIENNNESTGTWYKVFVNVGNNWSWDTKNHDFTDRALIWNLEPDTVYYFEMSVRSEDHLLDRVVLWNRNPDSGSYGYNFGNLGGYTNDGTGLDNLQNSDFFDPGYPIVEITSPAHATSVAGPASFTLEASASDPSEGGSIAQVEFFEGTSSLGVDNTAPYEMPVSGLAEGIYNFSTIATDNDGLTTASEANSILVSGATTTGQVSGELKQWHKVTVEFDGPNVSEDAALSPFTDFRLDVTFSHAASGETYTVPGYFAADGNAAESSATNGDVWKAHFAPTQTGEWSYSASFRVGEDAAATTDLTAGAPAGYFDGDTGTFQIATSDKTGIDFRAPDRGKLLYTGEHAMQWAGSGDFFFKVGMNHPEVFLQYNDFDNTPSGRNYSAHVQDIEGGEPTWKGGKGSEIMGVVNYLSNEGMNVQYFLGMNLRGDGKEAYPYTGSPGDENLFEFDVSKLAQWAILFDYMMVKGVMPHFVFDEQENQSLYEVLDPNEDFFANSRKVYYREMVARFGYLNAITWNLGEENGWQNNGTVGTAVNTEQRKAFADYFQNIIAYDDLVSIHNGPSNTDAIYDGIIGDPNYTGAAFQWDIHRPSVAFDRMALRRTQSAQSGHKWVVTYDEPYGSGADTNNPDTWRKDAMWLSTVAGAAGAEIWSGADLSLSDWRNYSEHFPHMKRAHDFLMENEIPFWRMDPDRSLVTSGYALAETGEHYLVYLPNGGTADLNLTGIEGTYTVQWFDPRNGDPSQANGGLENGSVTEVTGGGSVSLGTAPSTPTDDWVILVTRERKVAYIYGDAGAGGISQFEAMAQAAGYLVETHSDDATTLDANFLGDFEIVIFGTHEKTWSAAETTALDTWLQAGGGLLTYGGSDQAILNNLVGAYGLEFTVDQGTGTQTAQASAGTSNPIVFGTPELQGDDVAPIAVDPAGSASALISVATPGNTSGITITSPQYAALALAAVTDGAVVALFDDQPIADTGIGQADNEELLRRILAYLSGQLSEDGIEAVIGASPTEAVPPFTAQFNASGSTTNPIGTIVSYEWDFDNDGFTDATGRTASQEYTALGAYTVNLTVTDDFGLTDATSIAINAIDNEPFGNGGTNWPIPGKIEAENYDLGGQGISFNDDGQDAGGSNTTYRPGDGVDIDQSGSRYAIGWTRTGEWLEYSVTVAESGSYHAILQSTSDDNNGGGSFRILADGVELTENIEVPDTNSWWDFKDYTSQDFELEAGDYVLRLEISVGGPNVDSFEIIKNLEDPTDPFGNEGAAWPIPGIIEAENFDFGGQDFAYNDTSPTNQGGEYRTDETVDIAPDGSGGYAVSYTASGEWLQYTVNVTEPGNYSIVANASSDVASGGSLRVLVDDVDVTGLLVVPGLTGSWQTFVQIESTQIFNLSAGEVSVEIQMESDGFNLDSIEFVKERSTFGNNGEPWSIPGVIEAESFDTGGDTPTYFDTTATNQSGEYRPDESVDIDLDDGDGYAISYTANGEWLRYTANVTEAGLYSARASVSSGTNGTGTFRILVNGVDASGTMSFSQNTGWYSFIEIDSPQSFQLPAGEVEVEVQIESSNFNLDSIEFVKMRETFSENGQPWAVPGVIEAENFDIGGQGVAYNDSNPTSEGSSDYRSDEGADVNITNDGTDLFIGWTQGGEWLEYTIDVAETGTYEVVFRVASGNGGGGNFNLLVDGVAISPTEFLAPYTVGWQNWTEVVSPEITLTAGTHILRFETSTGLINFESFEIREPAITFTDFMAGYPSLTGDQALAEADPDGDEIPNILEQWLGLNPTSQNRISDYLGMVNEEGNLFFKLDHDNGNHSGELQLLTSETLTNWNVLEIDSSWISEEAGTRTIRVPTAEGVTEEFFRIRIVE